MVKRTNTLIIYCPEGMDVVSSGILFYVLFDSIVYAKELKLLRQLWLNWPKVSNRLSF